jgi:hypothetical protein
LKWRYDLQYNDIQQYDTHHSGILCEIQHYLI